MSPSQGRGVFDDCFGGVGYLNWKVSEMEECKGEKKKRLFRRIACSARTSKVTHYITTAFLKV